MTLQEYLASKGESQAAFARRLDVTQGMVWQWISGRRPVSLGQCIRIERATAGLVTREVLRPDIDWAALRESVSHEAA